MGWGQVRDSVYHEAQSASERWDEVSQDGREDVQQHYHLFFCLARRRRGVKTRLSVLDDAFGVVGKDHGDDSSINQHRITEVRENHRFDQLVSEVMQQCRGRSFEDTPQTVMAFLSVDRFSQQFVGTPGTPATILDNSLFLEGWSVYMGTDSPACASWVEKVIKVRSGTDANGNPKYKTLIIDRFGNSITSIHMRGDHWRKRHDSLKHVIESLCRWARLPVDVEVLEIFAPHIQHIDTLKTKWGHTKRQGMIPDMLFPTSRQLADIKTITCCKSNYSPERFRRGTQHDAVRVYQGKVTAQYRAKARKIDEEFNNHTGGNPGPVGLKLSSFGRVRGLVCGAFGEGSNDLHKLCKKIIVSAASHRFSDLGATSCEMAKVRATRYVYRTIGLEMMRGTANLKAARIGTILADDRSASSALRRRSAARVEWEAEREAYYYSHSYDTAAHQRPW